MNEIEVGVGREVDTGHSRQTSKQVNEIERRQVALVAQYRRSRTMVPVVDCAVANWVDSRKPRLPVKDGDR